jgi:hypothetical protein
MQGVAGVWCQGPLGPSYSHCCKAWTARDCADAVGFRTKTTGTFFRRYRAALCGAAAGSQLHVVQSLIQGLEQHIGLYGQQEIVRSSIDAAILAHSFGRWKEQQLWELGRNSDEELGLLLDWDAVKHMRQVVAAAKWESNA